MDLVDVHGHAARTEIVDAGGDILFALDDCPRFPRIWTNWTSVRKVKEGETTNDLFGFLTTE
jgi:hypothetical protein